MKPRLWRSLAVRFSEVICEGRSRMLQLDCAGFSSELVCERGRLLIRIAAGANLSSRENGAAPAANT